MVLLGIIYAGAAKCRIAWDQLFKFSVLVNLTLLTTPSDRSTQDIINPIEGTYPLILQVCWIDAASLCRILLQVLVVSATGSSSSIMSFLNVQTQIRHFGLRNCIEAQI